MISGHVTISATDAALQLTILDVARVLTVELVPDMQAKGSEAKGAGINKYTPLPRH